MTPVIRALLQATIRTVPLCSLALSIGCAPAMPPRELVDARATYDKVARGPAAQIKPDELLTARQQLDKAEATFKDRGDALETRDAAYIAIRKAELADSSARTVMAMKQRDDAAQREKAMQADQLRATQGELEGAKQALDRERTARENAEKRAAAAMADLQKIASVKKDDRGVVITLSGAVLFKTDKFELLPPAMVQLNQVADALARNNPDATIRVEGHTDAQGTESHNQELSENRARSVADYLISRGISKDRVSSVGLGSTKPVADNKSNEGRAQNRRVEIVVDNPPAK